MAKRAVQSPRASVRRSTAPDTVPTDRTLASTPGKVFSRDAIIDRLHGPGFAITDRTIDSHVRNLRGKFTAIGGLDVIETRSGIGYRLGNCAGAPG